MRSLLRPLPKDSAEAVSVASMRGFNAEAMSRNPCLKPPISKTAMSAASPRAMG